MLKECRVMFSRLYGLIRGDRTLWRLSHANATLECRVVRMAAGTQVQLLYRGELYHSSFCTTRAAAEDEARAQRVELIHRGWTELLQAS
jgi:hypothetical protein